MFEREYEENAYKEYRLLCLVHEVNITEEIIKIRHKTKVKEIEITYKCFFDREIIIIAGYLTLNFILHRVKMNKTDKKKIKTKKYLNYVDELENEYLNILYDNYKDRDRCIKEYDYIYNLTMFRDEIFDEFKDDLYYNSTEGDLNQLKEISKKEF